MLDEDLAWHIEYACFEAWPALAEKTIAGWRLRFAHGLTRRANSANPLRGTEDGTDQLIASVEVEYSQRHLPVFFRIPSLIGMRMPERLARLGYKREAESLVLHADIQDSPIEANDAVSIVAITSKPTEEWLATMSQLKKHDAATSAVYRQIIGAIKAPAAFAMLRDEGRIVALAYGVFHNGLFCLESVITDEAMRGRGYAKMMLHSLFLNAGRRTAKGFCLQVQADNATALRLYRNLGLRELYRYHYQGQ